MIHQSIRPEQSSTRAEVRDSPIIATCGVKVTLGEGQDDRKKQKTNKKHQNKKQNKNNQNKKQNKKNQNQKQNKKTGCLSSVFSVRQLLCIGTIILTQFDRANAMKSLFARQDRGIGDMLGGNEADGHSHEEADLAHEIVEHINTHRANHSMPEIQRLTGCIRDHYKVCGSGCGGCPEAIRKHLTWFLEDPFGRDGHRGAETRLIKGMGYCRENVGTILNEGGTAHDVLRDWATSNGHNRAMLMTARYIHIFVKKQMF